MFTINSQKRFSCSLVLGTTIRSLRPRKDNNKPNKDPSQHQPTKILLDKNFANRFQEKPSALVEYFKICLDKPLLQERCNQEPTLLNMQVFINPQGTNFRLTNEQWERIQELT